MPNGITSVVLSSSTVPGRAKISIKGKADDLLVPALPLTQSPNGLRVILINSASSVCWAASYSAPANTASTQRWKDKND